MSRKVISTTFEVVAGHLVRTVVLRDGRSYTQRCTLDAYVDVAYYVDGHATEGVTTNMMWDALPDVPCTQASVALDFLKERGCVTVRFRRCFPASDFLFEDAMVEFHALEHGASANG
jgi:hypothetical protein